MLFLVATLAETSVSQYRDDFPGRGDRNQSRNLDRTIYNIANDTRPFVRLLDKELDRSRYDGTRFEDEVNRKAKDFQISVARFERAYRSGANERTLLHYAGRMLDQGADLNRMLRRAEISRTVDREWSKIHDNLLAVARWHRARAGNSGR